jgi:hypothetical protein
MNFLSSTSWDITLCSSLYGVIPQSIELFKIKAVRGNLNSTCRVYNLFAFSMEKVLKYVSTSFTICTAQEGIQHLQKVCIDGKKLVEGLASRALVLQLAHC